MNNTTNEFKLSDAPSQTNPLYFQCYKLGRVYFRSYVF